MKPSQLNHITEHCPLGSEYAPSSVPASSADYLMREEDYTEKEERLIPLTQGQFAIVDKDKYEELVKYKWHIMKESTTCYARRMINLTNPTERIYILMHAQILDYPQNCEIDHKNHNGIDNRISNIRSCTRSQNQQNRRKSKNIKSTSIFKGVSETTYYKNTGNGKRWMAKLKYQNMNIYLGSFDSEIEAAKAYDAKALELFGEFAYTNF